MENEAQALVSQIKNRTLGSNPPPKSLRTFENTESACDFLEKQGIVISVAAVAKITRGKDDGPQEQSIRNNLNLRDYVKARRAAQGKATAGDVRPIKRLRTGNNAIDAYIQTLEAQLTHVKAEIRNLKQALPKLGDYDLQRALDDGTLTLVAPEKESRPKALQEAIETLLDPAKLAAVGLEHVATGQIISREHMNQVLLSKKHTEALLQFLERRQEPI